MALTSRSFLEEKSPSRSRAFFAEGEIPRRSLESEQTPVYRTYYHQLTSELSHLDSVVSAALQKQESEFMSIYRGQMIKVQRELTEIRKKCEEQNFEVKKDREVRKLKQMMEWFRDEALKLRESCKTLKIERDEWKTKATVAELELKHLSCSLHSAKLQLKSPQRHDPPSPPKTPPAATEPAESPISTSSPFLASLSRRFSLQDPRFVQEIEKFITSQQGKYQETIRHLQNIIDTEKRRTHALASSQSRLVMEHSELTELFLACVSEVRKQVAHRRVQSAARARPEAAAEEFSPTDKRLILERLVDSEEVLGLLYHRLFPSREAPSPPKACTLGKSGFSHRGRIYSDRKSEL